MVRTWALAFWFLNLYLTGLITRLDTYLMHSDVLWTGLYVGKKFSLKKCVFPYLVPGTRYQVEECKLMGNYFWMIFCLVQSVSPHSSISENIKR